MAKRPAGHTPAGRFLFGSFATNSHASCFLRSSRSRRMRLHRNTQPLVSVREQIAWSTNSSAGSGARFPSERKSSMLKLLIPVYPSRSLLLLICCLILSLVPQVLAAQAQGPQRVPVPVAPPTKRAPAGKKDRSAFPPVPTFKDIAEEVGLTISHTAASEAHYVIHSTSVGLDHFDSANGDPLNMGRVKVPAPDRLRGGGRCKGRVVQWGAWRLGGESCFFYHNRGDGNLEEVSVKAGVHDDIGYYGLGGMWGDYDDDGWPDLLVANDSVPNYLYHNNHDGTFTDVGLLTRVALSGEGLALENIGRDCGDYDH